MKIARTIAENIRSESGDVSHVVSNVIGDGCWVSWVILVYMFLYLTD
jgi:hypothetical protein